MRPETTRTGGLKALLKARFPVLVQLKGKMRKGLESLKPVKSVFDHYYQKNSWGSSESVSGSGSTLAQTRIIRRELPTLIRDFGAKSLLDVPCGDFHWMKEVELGVDTYVGADIVEGLIAANNARYANENRRFIVLNILRNTIPKSDVIFCRDCLIHFSSRHIFRALRNFKVSGCEYLVTTTFTRKDPNVDIRTGEFRPLNLQMPPFNFPEPIRLFSEGCTENDGIYSDKSLGVWEISRIPEKPELPSAS